MAIYLTNSGAATGESYADNIKVIKKADNSQAILAAKEIKEKINAAKPGYVIEIPDGKYESRIDVNVNGTEDKPIIIKAKNPGKAVFTNKGCLYISGSYIIIEDLLFEECNEKYVFMFNEDCTYSQIRNCAFLNNNPLKDDGSIDIEAQQKVVLIKGAYNKVSNCYFRGKSSVGQMAEIIRTTAKADYHIIENCYFGDFKEGPANGYETVRIGTSPQSLSSSFSTLRGCFFEKCNGEVETVSIKSCDNYIYNNTLYNTSGAIVLRHGNNSEVKGNLVIGGDPTTRVTGIRVIGENHKVYDNYFYNTPAKSDVLYISNGNPNPLIHEYLEVKNADVHNNTFINADSAIIAGEYLPSSDNASNRIIPPQGKIYNNAIISYKGYEPVVSKDTHATELILENNYVEGKKLTEKIDGVIEEEIGYTVVDNFIVPNNNLGANIEEVKKAPTSPYDVMPLWVKEQYYDTGKIKFEVVANDPFNNPDLKADDIFPKEGKINVILNGNVMKFDVDPQLINDRTMVPMRAIFEGFNATVSWDEATATATASTMTTTIKVTENSDIAYVNGAEHKLDSPAVIIDGRFLVPVRFISESFGATVKWIDETQTVDIEYVNQNFNGEYVSQHPNIAKALTIYSLIESGNDGGTHIPNVLDGSFASKWAFKETEDGGNGYGIFDLGSVKTLDKIYLANLAHKTRVYSFEIYVSEDGKNYTLAIPKTSATKKDGSFEAYDLNGVKARYVKYSGFGNNDNSWNNLVEVLITEK